METFLSEYRPDVFHHLCTYIFLCGLSVSCMFMSEHLQYQKPLMHDEFTVLNWADTYATIH